MSLSLNQKITNLTNVTNGIITVNNLTITEYAFNVSSTLGAATTYSENNTLGFNLKTGDYFDTSGGFNTTTFQYTIPTGSTGLWYFYFKLYIETSTKVVSSFGIFRNSSLLGGGGNYTSNSESVGILIYVTAGDLIDVRCILGSSISIDMSTNRTWFIGNKITPTISNQ